MASVSIRIDQEVVKEARAAAKAEYRTVQGQIETFPLDRRPRATVL